MAFARERLTTEQYRALTSWMEGADAEEICEELELGDADAARRLLRAAVAVLRRHFGP